MLRCNRYDFTRLNIANDPLARAGLTLLLADRPGLAIAGQIAGGTGALTDLVVYRLDVVVWDLGWDPVASLESLGELGEAGIPAVALLPDETHASGVWAVGIHGLLLRDTDADGLAAALIGVAHGLVTLDPSLAAVLVPTDELPSGSLVEDLTPRELDVLQLLAEGMPNKTIALRLASASTPSSFTLMPFWAN